MQLSTGAYNLNFLVPHNHFANFSVQPYHDATGHVAALPAGINIAQYAIEIDLSTVGLVVDGSIAAAAGDASAAAAAAAAAGSAGGAAGGIRKKCRMSK